jgi:hypothetical protein
LNRHAARLRPGGPSGKTRSLRSSFGHSFTISFTAICFKGEGRSTPPHEPLKTLGEFTVLVKLHKDVTAHLKVVIEKEVVAE